MNDLLYIYDLASMAKIGECAFITMSEGPPANATLSGAPLL
jgi:hypothetical protein